MILEWLFGESDPGHITPWNPVIAERHAAQTARMLLGACGPARTVATCEMKRPRGSGARASQMAGRARLFRMGALGQVGRSRSVA
jgi:hypothetical protein